MLPVRTKPYKDESFISWFCRLSFLNGTDPKGLALYIWKKDSKLYKDLDRQLSYKEIFELVKYSQLSFEEIKQLTLYPYIKKVNSSPKDTIYHKWYFLLPLGQKGRIRINGTSICSKCLGKKDSYINKYWRIAWVTVCPLHKIKLISHCPNCYQAILPQKLDYIHPHIYSCNKCNYDFRKTMISIMDENLYRFQNKLLSIFKLGKITSKNSFNLLLTYSAKDLFLTLHILLAFFHKILRQKNRFATLIKELNLKDNYSFTKKNNATFNRLNMEDRIKLLGIVYKLFDWNIDKLIKVLKKNGITSNILKQTFKNISPTIEYISSQLSNKKLVRDIRRTKGKLLSKNKYEVNKLLSKLNKYISNTKKYEELRNKLIQLNRNNNNYIKKNYQKEVTRPKVSHQILKRRVIYILNNLDNKSLTSEYIIKSLIGYFHWLEINTSNYMLKLKKEGFFICINKYEFYIPF